MLTQQTLFLMSYFPSLFMESWSYLFIQDMIWTNFLQHLCIQWIMSRKSLVTPASYRVLLNVFFLDSYHVELCNFGVWWKVRIWFQALVCGYIFSYAHSLHELSSLWHGLDISVKEDWTGDLSGQALWSGHVVTGAPHRLGNSIFVMCFGTWCAHPPTLCFTSQKCLSLL